MSYRAAVLSVFLSLWCLWALAAWSLAADDPFGSTKPTKAQQSLTRAVRQGKLDDVRRQLGQGVTPHHDAVFYAAGKKGDTEVLNVLLDAGVAPDMERSYPGFEKIAKTLLGTAVEAGRADLVRLLLKKGADPKRLHGGGSLVKCAAEKGHSEILALVAAGPEDLNRPDPIGMTPLHHAVASGNLETVRTALALGADPKAKEPIMGLAPLDLACRKRYTPVVEALLQAGAEGFCTVGDPLATRPTKEEQALIRSVHFGDVNKVRKLLAKGVAAHPDAVFSAAGNRGTAEVLGALLASGIDPGMERSFPGSEALAQTLMGNAVEADRADLARLLLDQGADPKRPHKGRPLAVWAAAKGDVELLTLVSTDADSLNLVDMAGRTALHQAIPYVAFTGIYDVLHAAVKLGADPNVSDLEGRTALHLACSKGYSSEIADILLKAGADPNARTHEGLTPLTLAVQKGSALTVQLLLAAGAEPDNHIDKSPSAALSVEAEDNPEPSLGDASLEEKTHSEALTGTEKESSPPRSHGGQGAESSNAEIFPNNKDLSRVESWKLAFSYSREYERQELLGGMLKIDEALRAEFAGEAVFTRTAGGRFKVARGETTYDYLSISNSTKSSSKHADIIHNSRGEGSGTAIIDHNSTLELDFEGMTYGLEIYPGGEDGFEIVRLWSTNYGYKEIMNESFEALGIPNYRATFQQAADVAAEIEREIEREFPLEGEGMASLLRDFAKQDFPNQEREDDRQGYSIMVDQYPLPFFGTVLAGSYTDYHGAVIAWRLEPLAKDGDNRIDPLLEEAAGFTSECWTHYHPPDGDTREEVVSMGAEIAAAWEGRRKRTEEIATSNPAQHVFVFQHEAQVSSGRTVCGDTLVPVKVKHDNLEVLSSVGTEEPSTQNFHLLSVTDPAKASPKDTLFLLNNLFSNNHISVDDRDLFNPLTDYPMLKLEDVFLEGGLAVIHLQGSFEEGQLCDREKIIAQITETVLYSGVLSSVFILLNDNQF